MKHKIVLLFVLLITLALLVQTVAANPVVNEVIFDDMEHGDPFGNDWFTFGGAVGGGGIGPNDFDLPPQQGGGYSLETGWGSGGVPGFYGGFGRTSPTDLSGTDHFNFWINPDAGQDYTLEINLQEDDNGDNAGDQFNDDEFQFNCVVSPTGPCAISGGGWQHVSIPLANFFDDNSFYFGGNGLLDAVPTTAGGNGQLINIVFAVIGNTGTDATFRTDYWNFSAAIVDDFESGLPSGFDDSGDPNPIPIGFFTVTGAGSTMVISDEATPPAPVLPALGEPNTVLRVDVESTSWAVMIHGFENETMDTWVSQDWSAYRGMGFWVYGLNSGTELFIDLIENRNEGSTSDDAERWTVTFTDDFDGWRYVEFPFSTFVRKEVGNGAPNDGLTLEEVYGWAFGTLGTAGPRTFYLDNIGLYGIAEIPELGITFSATEFEDVEGAEAAITVKLTRELGADNEDPTQVSIDYNTEPGTAIIDRDYTPVSGTLTFDQGSSTEQTFLVSTFDNPKHDGDKTVILRLTNPVDVTPGFATQAVLVILDDDPYDPSLLDDFERGAYLWDGNNVTLHTPEIAIGDPLALPNQGDYEHILEVETAVLVDIVVNGNICNSGNGVVPVALLTTDNFDALTVDHNTVRFGDAKEAHRDKKTGEAKRHEEDFDGDGDLDLIFHFKAKETGYDCGSTKFTLVGATFSGQSIVSGGTADFGRDFPLGQDWTNAEALSFWFYGTNSGEEITFQLKDNRAPDPGPTGWSLAWSDEFNDSAGTPPNPAYWSYEIGDGAANRIPGWGNSELQYYTNSTANSATDGQGNLVITASEADGSLTCYYGPCEYTSARLISQYKAEFAYGRIEARIQVPQGTGLWPAFWSLGSDIGEVGWPQTGEIDIMEFVGREPYEVFGTIHGPGYSGGQSFGGTYTFGNPVYEEFHTFTIEWEPDLIRWYVDDILYHTAVPADVAPNPWVFNDPIFLIMNVAIGGNFGGPVGEDATFPQEMVVDYVRVYQGPDTAERWETTFVNNFEGWQQVVIPFEALTRSANQPVGAPDDGLTLNEIWGYRYELPGGGTTHGKLWLDQVYLALKPDVSGIIIDDFEAGLPATWFQYGDYGAGTSIETSTVVVTDRPGGVPETSVLSVDYLDAGWGAGTGRDLVPPQDWSAYDGLSFWFYGSNSGTTFELILSDNKSDPNADTAERFHATFTDDYAGWQHITLPWSVFYRGAWQPSGAPDDGLTLTEMWAYAFALPSGTSGSFYLDDIAVYKQEIVEDFEAGLPANWFQYGDYGAGTSISTIPLLVTDRPGGIPETSVLSVDYLSAGWGAGTGQDLNPPRDWSASEGFSFWFYGTNTATTFELILSDNKTDPNADTAERFHATFTDNFAGWQQISLPWSVFFRGGWQPPGAPDDGLTLTEVWAYAFALPSGTTGTFYLDNISLVK